MSDVLNDDDASGFAAEFVLGTLDSPERARAQRMLGSDRSFTAMVKIWERRLGELHLMVEPVEPDPALWQRVRARALPASGSGAAVTPAAAQVSAGPVAVAASEPPPPPPPVPPAALTQPALAPEPAPEPASDAPVPIAPAPEPAELAPMQAAVASEAVSSTEVEALRTATAPAPAAAISAEPRFERVSEAPVEPKAPAPVRPPEPTVVIPVADRRPELSDRTARQLRHWRAFGLLMMLLAIGLGGLIATWRYAPERLPPQFRPLQVLHIEPVGPTARVRPPAPPDSQFNE
jgi:hypothetical protein